MLHRSLRLPREGFERTGGLRRTHTTHFSITYGAAQGSLSGSAVIVPKKVLKSAVTRHKLKRQVREILRAWSSKERIIIVSAKKGVDEIPFQDIQNELSTAFAAILEDTA